MLGIGNWTFLREPVVYSKSQLVEGERLGSCNMEMPQALGSAAA